MKPDQILDNLSTHVKNTIAQAMSLATRMRHPLVTCGHMLLALSEEEGCVGAEILRKAGVKRQAVEEALARIATAAPDGETVAQGSSGFLPELDANTRRALEKAMLLAYESGHSYVGTEHLLFGLLQVNDRFISDVLAAARVKPQTIQKQTETALGSITKFPEMDDVVDVVEELEEMPEAPQPHAEDTPHQKKKHNKKRHAAATALELFTVELTDSSVQKRIDPVVGRSEEIERLIHILCRRTKNNPVLIGEPGVGKTAIVEGLAKRIASGDVPPILQQKKIYSIDLALLISGTIYRGEFEGRLKQLLDEVSHNPDSILFIDEVHNIIGAGSNQGTMDAANILKPALARGELHCIGATTMDEYKKYISSDPALERRFQPISVAEPSRDETLSILKGIKKYYEKYHVVRIAPHALEAATDLSIQYIHDNFLPDKAIDLLDEAAARVKVRQKADLMTLQKNDLVRKRREIQKQKEAAIVAEQFDQAMKLKKQEEEMTQTIADIEKQAKSKRQRVYPLVTKQDIAAVLSQRLHTSASLLLLNEWEKLGHLLDRLPDKVIGQSHVVEQVVQTLRHAQIRTSKRQSRPVASFLFAGPSGVGKTAMARALAEELYHDPKALIKLDMSEFSEAHSVAKLLGSPAGYVGHGERNRFVEALKQRPQAVVLFDEIDKSHPDVTKLLLQILDEGTLTDSNGRSLSFRHTVIVLTTTIDRMLYNNPTVGFAAEQSASNQSDQHLREHLKRELDASLIGRLDTVCVFRPLESSAIEQIIARYVDYVNHDVLRHRGVQLSVPKAVVAKLASHTFDRDTGARYVEQKVGSILNELIVSVLSEKKQAKKKYIIHEQEGQFHIL